MKKLKVIILILMLFILSGCSLGTRNLENPTIYTTVYPLTYITEYLYGEDSTISSIYPDGVDFNNYTLTDKQIDEYSKGDFFVHLGLGNEKEFAKSFRNKNDDVLIIDATYGLNINHDLRELWLSPKNFNMLAKNIKNSLQEYLDNSVIEENIEAKYNELYVKVSWMDAELTSISKEAASLENNTLVIASNALKFFEENYKFSVVSLEDLEASDSESTLNDLRTKFKNSKYTTIIKLASEESSDLVNELVNDYKAKVITINDMITNSDTTSDYLTIQNENIAAIRNLLIK